MHRGDRLAGMSLPRSALQQQLNALEARLPDMIRTLPEPGDFWPEFAGHADGIADAAGVADFDWVHQRLDDMLRHHGAPEMD